LAVTLASNLTFFDLDLDRIQIPTLTLTFDSDPDFYLDFDVELDLDFDLDLDRIGTPTLTLTLASDSDVDPDPDLDLDIDIDIDLDLAIMLAIVVGNSMVVVAIAVDRRLKGVQHWFIGSLAVSDLLVGLFIMPLSLATELMGYWAFGDVICQLWLSTDVLLCTASILNLCLINGSFAIASICLSTSVLSASIGTGR